MRNRVFDEPNKRLRNAIDDFCRRCVGGLDAAEFDVLNKMVADCPQLDCPLHDVRMLSNNQRHRPSQEAIRLASIAKQRYDSERRQWSKEEDRKLLDWRDEDKPYWWIAAQLRRPEFSTANRWRKLDRIINPPDPLKGLVIIEEDDD